jgi:hypothetical protein
MRILVIPDVHLLHDIVNQILSIKELSYGKVLFLGDFFDSYNDSEERNASTAEWLGSILNRENFIFLRGNHCSAYLYPNNPELWVTGFTHEKARAILSKVNIFELRGKLKYIHREGNFVFSHAGVSRSFMEILKNRGYMENFQYSAESIENRIVESIPVANSYSDVGKQHILLKSGWLRGGKELESGGIIWCDIHEFEPVPNAIQMFGHTSIFPDTVGVKLCTQMKNGMYKKSELYLPEKDTRDYSHLFKNGCGIGIDSHLHGFSIIDPIEEKVEVYKLEFDVDIRKKYFDRSIVNCYKVWERKFKNED